MPALGAVVFVVLLISVGFSKIFGMDLVHGFLLLLDLIVLGVLAAILYAVCRYVWRLREPVARWYYFTFHPHPAEPAIRSALADGTVLDGQRLATILGDAPADRPILRAVRAQQAQALIAEMQTMTRAKIRELEASAKEQYEHAAAHEMQTALAQAAIALERAKAVLQARPGATT